MAEKSIHLVRHTLFDLLPGERGWFATGEQPAGGGSGDWDAEEDRQKVDDWSRAQRAEVVAVSSRQPDIGAGGT